MKRLRIQDFLTAYQMPHLTRGASAVLHLTATMAGAGNCTIHRCTPVGVNVSINWGDGTAPTVVVPGDTAAKVHAYGGAGTYLITISPASIMRQLDIHDPKLSGFDSADLADAVLTYFRCYSLGAAVANIIDSADMAGWTPTDWLLYTMPAGGTYSIDSADMVGWTPMNWNLFNMPAGTYSIDSAHMAGWTPTDWRLFSVLAGTYTINSLHMAGWTPTNWYLYSMPAGTYTINSLHMAGWTPTTWQLSSMPAGTYTINSANMAGWTPTAWQLFSMAGGGAAWTLTAADFAGWTTTTSYRIDANALTQAQVDAVLYGMYQASIVPRTVAGGTINVAGTNAAPSGVFQAAAACPVDAATPGKEVAHELLNDGCGAGFNVWATVTYTP